MCSAILNVFGPRQLPDTQYAAAVPIFIRQLLRKEPPTIFGDGGQTRDLISVRDVVRANAALALGVLGAASAGAALPLGVLLRDDAAKVRLAAAQALDKIGDAAVLETADYLVGALRDGDDKVAETVAGVLRARKTRMIGALVRGLETDDPRHARRIVEVIDALPDASEILCDAFDSPVVVGAGGISRAWFPPLIKEQVEVAAVVDIRKENAEARIKELLDQERALMIKEELSATYNRYGAQWLNAFTSYDYTGYIVIVPRNKLELWAMLESSRMNDPIFREFFGIPRSRQQISVVEDCEAEEQLDDGSVIRVKLSTINHPPTSLRLDFTGTPATHPGNLNATIAIVQSAVLYVLRLFLQQDRGHQNDLGPSDKAMGKGAGINHRFQLIRAPP